MVGPPLTYGSLSKLHNYAEIWGSAMDTTFLRKHLNLHDPFKLSVVYCFESIICTTVG